MTPRREVVTSDGIRISYLVAGDGAPLVLIPGRLQSAEAWHRAGYFDGLTGQHRVIAVDLLGHGQSDVSLDRNAYSPESVVVQLLSVFERESVESAAVWGYSSGAEYAIGLARRRPDLVSRVVVGCLFLGDMPHTYRLLGPDHAAKVERVAGLLERGDWEAYFDSELCTVSAEDRSRAIAENDPRVVSAQLRSDLLRPRGFVLPSVPTLAYWGEGEWFHSDNAERAEALPIASGVVVGDSGAAFHQVASVLNIVRPFLEASVRV